MSTEAIINDEWKNKDKKYLKELQMFLDVTDNIEDEKLKKNIVYQMLRCDQILTELAKKNFANYYKMGYKKAKDE